MDCACKLFRREALDGLRVESGGAFFSAELLIKLRAAGRCVAEVGVPHYPRTAGSPTGAKPSVILRAVRDFWRLRLQMWVNRRARAAASGSRSWPPTTGLRLAADSVSSRSPVLGVHVERVHEIAEDVEPRVDDLLARGLQQPTAFARRRHRGRRRRQAPAWSSTDGAAKIGAPDPDRERERVGRPRVDLADLAVALDERGGRGTSHRPDPR